MSYYLSDVLLGRFQCVVIFSSVKMCLQLLSGVYIFLPSKTNTNNFLKNIEILAPKLKAIFCYHVHINTVNFIFIFFFGGGGGGGGAGIAQV